MSFLDIFFGEGCRDDDGGADFFDFARFATEGSFVSNTG